MLWYVTARPAFSPRLISTVALSIYRTSCTRVPAGIGAPDVARITTLSPSRLRIYDTSLPMPSPFDTALETFDG